MFVLIVYQCHDDTLRAMLLICTCGVVSRIVTMARNEYVSFAHVFNLQFITNKHLLLSYHYTLFTVYTLAK